MRENLAATTAESGPVTAWLWVLHLGRIVTREGVEFDLAARTYSPRTGKVPADVARKSLSAWYAKVRPALKVEHGPANVYGRATGQTRWLTGREAIACGVSPGSVPAAALDAVSLFAEFVIDDAQLAAAYRAGRVRSTSPALALHRHDDEGVFYEAVNEELSVTATPVQHTHQVDARGLVGVALSAETNRPVGISLDAQESTSLSSPQTDQRVRMDENTAPAAAAEPTLADLLTRIEACEAQIAAMGERMAADAPTADDEKEKPDAEMSALRAENAKLRGDLARRDATAKLAAVEVPADKLGALVELGVRDPAALDTVLACLPAPPERTTAALGVTHPQSPQAKPITVAELAADANAAAELSARAHKAVADGKFPDLTAAYASLITGA